MIKTGFCVSYDWQLLRTSLPRVYRDSDIICLGVDKNRRSWAGKPYDFQNDEFYEFINSIDKEDKIIIYEDDFSLKSLNARENCNRHRMKIAERMGTGGWHLQVDSDEYFLDFHGFTSYLKRMNPSPSGKEKPFNVCVQWIPLLKRLKNGYLYIDFRGLRPEMAPVATTKPNYERARHNGYFNRMAPFFLVHETWARGEEELWFKLNNWGHAVEELDDQFKRTEYFEFWRALDRNNYHLHQNVHPATPSSWPAINYGEGSDINSFLDNLKLPDPYFSGYALRLSNNRNWRRIKAVLNKLNFGNG